jgi:cytoskeletal protein CcmA (bactofilin family)
MRTRIARTLALGFMVCIGLAALAPTAGAQTLDDIGDRDRRIAVGDAFLREGERIDGPVIAIDGNATANGRTDSGVIAVGDDATVGDTGVVDGDVFVVDGNARIEGRVTGDVVAIEGRAVVTDGATVGGDVRSTKQPRVERGAQVRGEVKKIDVTGWFSAIGIRVLGFFWLAVTVSTAVFGLLLLLFFPRAAQTTSRIGRGSTGKSIGVGLLVAIGLPVVAVLAVITIVGLPFGLGIGGALGLIHAVGYVAGAFCFGRILVKEPKSAIGAFFAGWAILRVLALIPGIGVLVWIAATVWGLGALTVGAWRAGRGALEPPPEPKAPAMPPAADAPAEAEVSAVAWGAGTDTDTETMAGDEATDDATAEGSDEDGGDEDGGDEDAESPAKT